MYSFKKIITTINRECIILQMGYLWLNRDSKILPHNLRAMKLKSHGLNIRNEAAVNRKLEFLDAELIFYLMLNRDFLILPALSDFIEHSPVPVTSSKATLGAQLWLAEWVVEISAFMEIDSGILKDGLLRKPMNRQGLPSKPCSRNQSYSLFLLFYYKRINL